MARGGARPGAGRPAGKSANTSPPSARARFTSQNPSVLTHSFRPPETPLLFYRGMYGRNQQFGSWSFVANSLLRSTAGVAAARASRSKLSASSKTAFLAPGSVNCPATSRACSARSSHSQASFRIDGIFNPPSIAFPGLLVFALLFWACEHLRPIVPKGGF